MSFLSGVLPQLASLMAQPAVLAAGVAAGVAVGTVGVATGAIPVTDSPSGGRLTALYECPDGGRVVTNLAADQNVLVTARNADGSWLQLYLGQPGAERAWARATSLQLKAAPDSLPIAECTPTATAVPGPTTIGAPSVAPSVTPSESIAPSDVPASTMPSASPSALPSATPAPTKTPVPTATPTPAPTSPGPYLTELTVNDVPFNSGTGSYVIYPQGCTGYYTMAPITVRANDPDGIQGVTLYYRPYSDTTSAPAWRWVQMDWEGEDLWYGAFGSDGTWGPGVVEYYVQGYDNFEHSTKLFPDAQHTVELQYCSD